MLVQTLALLHGLLALCALILSFWLVLEVAAAWRRPGTAPTLKPRGRAVVVIPAHNEEDGLGATLDNVNALLGPEDSVLVVADNCADNTAEVARSRGAETLERTDAVKRGKGFALQFAFDHLHADPPSTVILLDADCLHSDGFVDQMAGLAEASGQPVQSLCLMKAQAGAGPARAVAAFAWLFLNQVRMLGLSRLAGTARLTGAGEALPWSIVEQIDLGSGEIVEDLALTMWLAKRDIKVLHHPHTLVTSYFPENDDATTVQRARWEHGSLRILQNEGPAMVAHAAQSGALWKLALALDVLIPPLSVYMAALLGLVLVGAVLALLGPAWPLTLAAWALALFVLALGLGWWRYGREALPPKMLSSLIPFILSKFNVYGRQARQSSKAWTRTPRDSEKGKAP